MSETKQARFDAAVVMALLAVYILWGGTYLAMRFGVETIPPFLMAGTRFLIAGLVLFALEYKRGAALPSVQEWRGATLVGGLLLLGGNGGVVWAEQTVPSGIAAIIVATVPLWMVILAWLWQGGRRPTLTTALGLALGFGGIIALTGGNSSSAEIRGSLAGYVVLILAAISWAAGSVYSRKAVSHSSPFMSTAIQMLAGGVLCLLAGLVTGEIARLDVVGISLRSLLSLGYLIVFGSLVAYTAYIWLLKVADTALVSTYAYVNPVVALLLGWLLGGEAVGGMVALAAALILAGVVIISRDNMKNGSASQSVKRQELEQAEVPERS